MYIYIKGIYVWITIYTHIPDTNLHEAVVLTANQIYG